MSNRQAVGAMIVTMMALSGVVVHAQNHGPRVTVENVPLPITGTVAVTQAPPVALVPGATVSIHPAGNTVEVSNATTTPVNARNVDNPALQPFQFQSSEASFEDSPKLSFGLPILQAPHKALVIEAVTALCRSLPPPEEQILYMQVSTTGGGVTATHTIPCTQIGLEEAFPPVVVWQCGMAIRMYADPGTGVVVGLRRLGQPSSRPRGQVTVTGYLVDTQ